MAALKKRQRGRIERDIITLITGRPFKETDESFGDVISVRASIDLLAALDGTIYYRGNI